MACIDMPKPVEQPATKEVNLVDLTATKVEEHIISKMFVFAMVAIVAVLAAGWAKIRRESQCSR